MPTPPPSPESAATVPPHPEANGPALPPAPVPTASGEEPSREAAERVQVPGYEVLEELGRGSMGVVYRARHQKLNRVVALKMVLAGGYAGPDERTRFLAEAEAVAALQHPHIVQLYEFGQHDGLPFFTLEYAPGGSLAAKLNGTPLPPREAARLVEQLARAVHYAHGQGIIHRDLKPGNVLLAADGTPKITDFGLAKRVEVGSGLTASGAILGTPGYMAPEQASGGGKHVGPAGDVYALGAILYECLTGRPPFKAATMLDTLLQVLSEEPASVRQLQPGVPADLDTVCQRCLQKEPGRRYASAEELAEDLRRFQAGEPIRARPVGSAERTWRWCRRNPAVAGLLAAVVATLLLGTGVAMYFAVAARTAAGRARDNEQRAEAAAEQARESRQRAAEEERQATESRQQAFRVQREVERQLTRAERLLYEGQIERAHSYWREGDTPAARDLLDRCRWDYRGWEHAYLHTLFDASQLTFRGHSGALHSVRFSPDGRRLASASYDGWVKVWDAQTGQELRTLQGHTGPVHSMCFSPDGRRLASAGGSYKDGKPLPGEVKVWDAQTGRELLPLKGHTGPVWSVAYSPDGSCLATASDDKTVKVWDAHTGREIRTLKGHAGEVRSVAYSPNGGRLASASEDHTVKIWDAHTGREVLTLTGHTEQVTSVCFSPDPDGRLLASAAGGSVYTNGKLLPGEVKIWDAQTGQEQRTLKDYTVPITSVCFSPDGRRLAGASQGFDVDDEALPGEVKVWNLEPGQEPLTLKGHTGPLRSVCFSPDGRRLASASEDQTIKVWDARPEQLTLKGHGGGVNSVVFSPDGRRLASIADDLTLIVWDAQTGQELLTLQRRTAGDPEGSSGSGNVCFSPDGRRLASSSGGRLVFVWDAQTGQEQLTLRGHTREVYSVCFSPDGRRLASASGVWDAQKRAWTSGEVKVWDAQTGQEILSFKGHTLPPNCVCFSPDGRRLATASNDRLAKVWDAHTGRELRTLKGHARGVNSVCFSPDGRRLASAADDQTVRVWDAESGQDLRTLQGHTRAVYGVCFSPDGARLASASTDRTSKLWDAETGQELLTLRGHANGVYAVCFSPDGARLASASTDQTCKVWDAQTGPTHYALRGHTDGVLSVCFSPDGRRLASASFDRTVKVWDGATGQEQLTLKEGHTDTVRGVCFSPDGRRLASASWDRTVMLWDAQTGQELRTLKGHTGQVHSVCFGLGGRRLASGSQDQTVRVWDPETGQALLTLRSHTDQVHGVCFSPDGRLLASASFDRTVIVWDAQTGQKQRTLTGHIGQVHSVCFSPDGRRLASAAEDHTLKVWDTQTGQEVRTLHGHTGWIRGVCFSPDGHRLASASQDLMVKVWDVPTGPEQRTFAGHTRPVTRVGFSPDGRRVLAADDQGQVRSWDAHTGQEFVPCTDPLPPLQLQAVSPDGQRVVRIDHGRPVVEPRLLRTEDLFRRRLDDPVATHQWHLQLAREARDNQDAFALAFHLQPLLLTAFTQRDARPRDTFPLWAGRPPLTRSLAGAELQRLHDGLSRQLDAEPKAWGLWAARGWCRHLLGDLAGSTADLKQALALRPDEPGLWAVLGSIYLKHQQPQQAEALWRHLAGRSDLDVAVWHSVEATACEEERDWATASWHLDRWLARLPTPAPQLLARRGRAALELGREKEAARDYAAAVRAGRRDADTLGWHARLCVATGDPQGYRQACTSLLQLGEATAAWPAMLAPGAGVDFGPLLKKLSEQPGQDVAPTTRGGLLLRAGRFAEAVAALQQASAQRRPGQAPVADFLLALAQQKQGQTAAARQTLKRARFAADYEAPLRQAAGLIGGATAALGAAPMTGLVLTPAPQPYWDWGRATRLELRVLRQEAEQALGERKP